MSAAAGAFLGLPAAAIAGAVDGQGQATIAVHSGALDCRRELAQWNAEVTKIPAGPPSSRMEAMEKIAGKMGEEDEQCLAESVRKALQAERSRLLMMRVDDQSKAAAEVYSCPQLTKNLKCIGSIADDTAHLSESFAPVLALSRGQHVKVEPGEGYTLSSLRVYLASEASLMDAPRYREMKPGKNGDLMLPDISARMVLFAILKEPRSGLYDKFVWLLQPGLPRKN